MIKGKLVSVKIVSGDSWLLKDVSFVSNADIAHRGEQDWQRLRGNIRIQGEMSEAVRSGDVVTLRGRVRPIRKARNPGVQDWQRYWYTQGVIGRMEEPNNVEIVKRPTFSMARARQQASQWMYAGLLKHLSAEQAGMAMAMLTGEKSTLSDEVYEGFQQMGLAHLLTVSGLHIGIAYYGLDQLLVRLEASRKTRDILGFILVGAMLFLSGFRFSGIRAGAFVLLRRAGTWLHRPFDGLTALAVVAFAQLLVQPLALFNQGFQLAFGAVLAIFGPAQWMSQKLKKRVPVISHFICVPLSVHYVLTPILLLHNSVYLTYGPLFNIPAGILSAWLMPVLVVGSLLSYIPLVGGLIFTMVSELLSLLSHLTELAQRLPGLTIEVAALNWKGWLLWALPLAVVLLLPQVQKGYNISRERLWKGCALIVIILVLLPATITSKVTVLDVGQGDALMISEPSGARVLVDGGPKEDLYEDLLQMGVGHFSAVVVSHAHSDHYAGLMELPNHMTVDQLIYPMAQSDHEDMQRLIKQYQGQGAACTPLEAGQKLRIGAISFSALWPDSNSTTDENNNSLVLLGQVGSLDVLLTGDIESETETLISKNFTREVDVLKVPHHGSPTSSTSAFLSAFPARVATVSAGEWNAFGHPAPDVISRLVDHDMQVFQTNKTGAVEIWSIGDFRFIRPWLDWTKTTWYNEKDD